MKKMKNVPSLSVSLSHLSHRASPPRNDLNPLYLTYQDSGDYVRSVLEAVSVVAASHEAGGSHILFIFIPVANLRQGEYMTKMLKVTFCM